MFPVPRNHPAVRACFALTAIHVLQLSTAYRVAAGSPQDDEPPAAAAALLINICRRLSSLSLSESFSPLFGKSCCSSCSVLTGPGPDRGNVKFSVLSRRLPSDAIDTQLSGSRGRSWNLCGPSHPRPLQVGPCCCCCWRW